MDKLAHINHTKRSNNYSTTLCTNLKRRLVFFNHRNCMPRVSKNDLILDIIVRGVIKFHRVQKHNQSANPKQPNGLDQNRHTRNFIHHSNQFSLLGHFESRRGRISSHISA